MKRSKIDKVIFITIIIQKQKFPQKLNEWRNETDLGFPQFSIEFTQIYIHNNIRKDIRKYTQHHTGIAKVLIKKYLKKKSTKYNF